MIARFNSIGDFARRAAQVPTANRTASGQALDFTGGTNYNRAVELALKGDDSLVPKAMAMLDKLDSEIETPPNAWLPSIHGAYPMVPEYLAGAPDCMRRLQPGDPAMLAPISVYASIAPSACFTADAMMKRGIAILALLLKLQQVRPVRLVIFEESDGIDATGEVLTHIEVNSQPFDLSTVCFALTNASFVRHLVFSNVAWLNNKPNGYVVWPREYGDGGDRWEKRVRQVVGMEPQDLYIRAMREWDDLVLADPIAWVNGHIERMRLGENEL